MGAEERQEKEKKNLSEKRKETRRCKEKRKGQNKKINKDKKRWSKTEGRKKRNIDLTIKKTTRKLGKKWWLQNERIKKKEMKTDENKIGYKGKETEGLYSG